MQRGPGACHDDNAQTFHPFEFADRAVEVFIHCALAERSALLGD